MSNNCTDAAFPAYRPQLPPRADPANMVLVAVPATASAVLWCLFWSQRRRPRPSVAPLGAVLALAATAAQGVLLVRGFRVLGCEGAVVAEWAWPAVATLAIVHLLLVLVVVPQYPWLASGLPVDAAFVCVAGEWAGRDLRATSAVQHLVPLQQLFCIVAASLLLRAGMAQKGARWGTVRRQGVASGVQKVEPTGGGSMVMVDPLHHRPEDHQEEGERMGGTWSWFF